MDDGYGVRACLSSVWGCVLSGGRDWWRVQAIQLTSRVGASNRKELSDVGSCATSVLRVRRCSRVSHSTMLANGRRRPRSSLTTPATAMRTPIRHRPRSSRRKVHVAKSCEIRCAPVYAWRIWTPNSGKIHGPGQHAGARQKWNGHFRLTTVTALAVPLCSARRAETTWGCITRISQ